MTPRYASNSDTVSLICDVVKGPDKITDTVEQPSFVFAVYDVDVTSDSQTMPLIADLVLTFLHWAALHDWGWVGPTLVHLVSLAALENYHV